MKKILVVAAILLYAGGVLFATQPISQRSAAMNLFNSSLFDLSLNSEKLRSKVPGASFVNDKSEFQLKDSEENKMFVTPEIGIYNSDDLGVFRIEGALGFISEDEKKLVYGTIVPWLNAYDYDVDSQDGNTLGIDFNIHGYGNTSDMFNLGAGANCTFTSDENVDDESILHFNGGGQVNMDMYFGIVLFSAGFGFYSTNVFVNEDFPFITNDFALGLSLTAPIMKNLYTTLYYGRTISWLWAIWDGDYDHGSVTVAEEGDLIADEFGVRAAYNFNEQIQFGAGYQFIYAMHDKDADLEDVDTMWGVTLDMRYMF